MTKNRLSSKISVNLVYLVLKLKMRDDRKTGGRRIPEPRLRLNTHLLPALVGLLLLLQLALPYGGWIVLLVGLGGGWLIGYLWARSLGHGLRLIRETRFGQAQVGDRLEERFTLVNDGWAPALWVELIHHSTLPDEVPARVLALARNLTATEPTPYDRARAIERYLRTFPYTLDLPGPLSGRDVVDYFLFDLRQGYCDYYATAMVVLAWAAGLPARLAVGYASGTYDAPKAHYVITEADAHTWAEVYFPGYGWVEFEPTAGRPLIERPAEALLFETSEPKALLKPMANGRVRPAQLGSLGLLGALLALTLGGLTWWVADGWRLRRMSPGAAVVTLYQRLYRHGQRLAVPGGGWEPRRTSSQPI